MLFAVLTSAAQAGEREEIPLTDPEEIIRVAPAPPDTEPKIAKEAAVELAGKYSGFEVDEAVQAKLVLYADTAHPRGENRPLFPYHEPVAAWLVYLPNASFERKRHGGEPELVKCPLNVGIHAESGRFLGAFGNSEPNWAKGGKNPSRKWESWSFAEPEEEPRLSVRKVLKAVGHRPSSLGQFFVRYLKMSAGGPEALITRVESQEASVRLFPAFHCWLYSQRGVVIYGFSVPPGYQGPEPYATCSDYVVSDLSGESILMSKYK